jgi:hypothetical protein
MKKILIIIFLLLIIGSMAFSIDITKLSYQDLKIMTYNEQLYFFEGFILGSYAVASLLGDDSLVIKEISVKDLITATLHWYETTGLKKIPIYVAIYRRDIIESY